MLTIGQKIFGALKQQARARVNKSIAENIFAAIQSNTQPNIIHMTKQDPIMILVQTWDNLTSAQIMNAWDLALNGREDASNDDV